MIGLVVTGHGHFADGIHTSAQMIAGGVYGKVVSIDNEDTLRVKGPQGHHHHLPLCSPEPAEVSSSVPLYSAIYFTFLS